MYSNTSHVSTYRYQSCDVLLRIYYVTGQEFPISGDAPLRMKTRLLVTDANKIHALHQANQDNPCDECNGTGRYLDPLDGRKTCQACNGTGRHQC